MIFVLVRYPGVLVASKAFVVFGVARNPFA